MATITRDEIEQNVSSYLQRVKTGETLVILENGEPIAEIKPVEHAAKALRPYALCAGEFSVPADFDVPLPKEITDLFEGE